MEPKLTYTDREIQFHFETINDKLDAILAQTTRTNGRVTKCEENISNQRTSGKVANWAFGLTIPLIISMSVWIFFNQLQTLSDEINAHIELSEKKLEALSK